MKYLPRGQPWIEDASKKTTKNSVPFTVNRDSHYGPTKGKQSGRINVRPQTKQLMHQMHYDPNVVPLSVQQAGDEHPLYFDFRKDSPNEYSNRVRLYLSKHVKNHKKELADVVLRY